MSRPIVICCTQRFKEELEALTQLLRSKGVLVFAPDFKYHKSDTIKKDESERLESDTYRNKVPGLVWAHFNNLDLVHGMGGICLIFNPLSKGRQRNDYGYIGSNTQGEIGHANGLKMPVLLMRPHREKWIMTVAHERDPNRIFTNAVSGGDPLNNEEVYEKWLRYWLGMPSSAVPAKPAAPIQAPASK